MAKKITKYLPFIFFFAGIIMSYIFEFTSNDNAQNTVELTYDELELFKIISLNNYTVCLILILGFLTLGLSSLIIVIYNGYIFGICFQILPIESVVSDFLCYSIIESLGVIISCQIALQISIPIIKNLTYNIKLSIDKKSILTKITLVTILILTASIIEVYVSIN